MNDDFEYSELRARRSNSFLRTLNRLLKFAIFCVIIGFIVLTFGPQVNKKRETERRIEQLKAEVEKQKELLARRKREEDLLKNDPQYLEIIARDKLGLMKEGETIIRIEPNNGPKPLEKIAH